ncbi:MAG: deoxyribodipyrimidine photolyase [Phycisphaerae bacterium]
MTRMPTTLVWFRSDLRIEDHPALATAVRGGGAVVPVFIWSPQEEGDWPAGAASRWWLHRSLAALADSLERRGSRLVIRRGPGLAALRALIRETGAVAVHWSRQYEPAVRERDRAIESALRADGVRVETHPGSLCYEPERVLNEQGRPFQVFTAYWRACLRLDEPAEPVPAPRRIRAPACRLESLPIESLGLEPRVDWAVGLRATWQPGEHGARRRLRDFLTSSLEGYAEERDRPDHAGTSRLSPHLHFGELSARRIWHEVRARQAGGLRPEASAAADAYLRELGWREFAHHLLHHFPQTTHEPLKAQYWDFPWDENPEVLEAWRRGRTGYPIVDAGMRELWSTGWMHNRVRMIVASFLVKHLLIDWRCGAAWFWDTLVDADLANNTLGWQWVAGCGADAAPYFRIFNPVLQGRKFDPQGDYVRRWVPELGSLSDTHLHAPWEAPPTELRAAGIRLGRDYPNPIVNHAEARQRALAALHGLRGGRRGA